MDVCRLPQSELPESSRLFRDFLATASARGSRKLSEFYPHPPTLAAARKVARSLRFDAERRCAIAEILHRQNREFAGSSAIDASVADSLHRLERGACAVVTGQQVGLFGGPAYTFYKALTAIRVAKDLTARGADAVPIFWLASEDHDFAEVRGVDWLGRDALAHLAITGPPDSDGRSVGGIALGTDAAEVVQRAVDALDGAAARECSAALREAYTPGANLAAAFAHLLAHVLRGRGLILLNPLDPRIQRLAAPVYRRSIEEAEPLSRALLERKEKLARAGYHAQVKVTSRSTLLFLYADGRRTPLQRNGSAFTAGDHSFTRDELLARCEAAPQDFSPSALLRPVVQDSILPTAAIIGGPAEIAYFAQSRVLYDALLGRMPVLLSRAGFTLVEPHVARLLKKYSLEVQDVLREPAAIRRRMERAVFPAGLERRFAAAEGQLKKLLREVRKPVGKLDATLAGAADTAERKMLYQLGKLRDKAARAAALRAGVIQRHERILLDALLPAGHLQERRLSLLPFLSRAGMRLLDELEKRTADAGQHTVLRV